MRASIVIASHRRTDLLRWNLQSLSHHGCDGVEILILDDSRQTDQGCEGLATEFGCRYVHSGQTKTEDGWRIPGFAFNIGARLAQGETLVLSCAEVYHPHNTLKSMLSVMKDESIVIPKCIRDDRGGVLAQLLQGLIPETRSIEKLRALDARLPFFMAMKRDRFLDIGGYDEDFTGVCWDDNDITDRLVLSGGNYVTVPQEVVHLHHPRHNYRSAEIMQRWEHNKAIYDARKGQVVRNKGRRWGNL